MVSRDDLGIIKKIDEHIKGMTNPYVQVVESSAGRKARTCRGPKVTMSTLSASSTLLASLTITSACNPDKLELVEVKIENINRKKEKIRTLLDTGANISVFEPEILPKLGLSVENLVKETKISKSADGSSLRTQGSVQV